MERSKFTVGLTCIQPDVWHVDLESREVVTTKKSRIVRYYVFVLKNVLKREKKTGQDFVVHVNSFFRNCLYAFICVGVMD